VHLERSGVRRRLLVLAPIAVIAIVAAACLPPAPPPPPPTTTTTTQPPAICGVNALTATAAGADATSGAPSGTTDQYVAVVERNGRSEVLTREASSAAELARFRAEAAAQGEITAFEADGEVHALAETPSWGFTDSGFATAWGDPTSTGTGVRVAEIDTGIDTAHPDLSGHFDGTGADFVVATAPSNPPVDTTDPSTSGHGTHVAGIVAATAGNDLGVAGGAPGVTLVPVRVLGVSADVTKGNASVITMSLGGTTTSDAVSQAIATVEDPDNANYTHPVITVAAGNSSCTSPLFPSTLASTTPQMLSVSALCKVGTTSTNCSNRQPWPGDNPYKLADYSSKAWNGVGTPTGISAPGTEILSTLPGGAYGKLSGTSMATPLVAAAAALVKQYCPSDTAAQIVQRLETSARDLGRPGPDTLYGYGKLDAAAAVASC
jgi:serine protease